VFQSEGRLRCRFSLHTSPRRGSCIPVSTQTVFTIVLRGGTAGPPRTITRRYSAHARDFTQDYVSGVASHFGLVSLPHFLGSSLCIVSIAFAVSGCFSITCFVMVLTISSHDPADSFCSQGPPSDLRSSSSSPSPNWFGCLSTFLTGQKGLCAAFGPV
jgi:hypothetical protein